MGEDAGDRDQGGFASVGSGSDLLGDFGDTLTNVPDELRWDGLRGEHDRKHPDRWID